MSFIFWVCALLIAHTYLFYPLILTIMARFISRSSDLDEAYLPSVSMVVAAYNEDDVIEAKLMNCAMLSYPQNKLEILIGSDGSTDRTNEIINNCLQENIQLIAYPERQGKLNVLNATIPRCQGEIVVLSDANTMYQPEAIRKLVRHFVDPQVGGVCGQLLLLNPNDNSGGQGEGLYWKYENMLKRLEGRIGSVIGANGAIYAIRRSLFEPLPAHKVVMDDFLIPLKIVEQGYRTLYEPEAIANENTSFNMTGEFTRKVRIGAANFNVIPEVARLLHPLRGFPAFALWSHKIIRWFVPFIAIIALIMNLFLLDQAIFIFTLVLQIAFYLSALMGFLGDRLCLRLKLFHIPYYLTAMNTAMLLGFWRSITHTQQIAWQRVER